MKRDLLLLALSLMFAPIVSAQTLENGNANRITAICDSIRHIYAPDRRTAIFDVEWRTLPEHTIVLAGSTTLVSASEALERSLSKEGFKVENGIGLLPDVEETNEKTLGVVNVSVCNLRAAADYDAGQSTQALLGMPVRIIKRESWLLVQTPDKYLAWVLPASIQTMNKEELEQWNRSPQIVVTAVCDFVYKEADTKSQTVGDIVAGNRLKWMGEKGKFYRVAYPDGREGYIAKGAASPIDQWRKNLKQDAASILATGLSLNGIPYMWGGTSTKGMDCSGFVRTVLLMHDIIIPRDASQQAYKGKRVEIAQDFDNLEPGDLLFFGRKATEGSKERVSHVGIYMGNKKFIHSLGWVHVSSFNPKDADYDEYDLNRLLFAARILPYINKEEGLNTTDKNEFYK